MRPPLSRLDVQIQEEGPVPQLREHMMGAQEGQILPPTAGGERHGCLYHWSTAVGTAGDGLVRGISPEDGPP